MGEQWTPKVGDKVMIGEHGPYEVRAVHNRMETVHLLLHYDSDPALVNVGTAMWSWLTPAPEPEPDEPTAFGALVRDGDGRLWVRSPYGGTNAPEWDAADRLSTRWSHLPRPITVVLADPAEVETLREKVAEGQRLVEEMTPALIERDALRAERDELQRRIDAAQEWMVTYPGLRRILRGES